ncbi:MAG TPA: zinc-finger domain-containing protein [Alphaproteobacteria bacterium]|nr:zinc-finger domain-containing protein [Alphaproteobacteria bacterium]HAJ46985.1 zinc-finger domain-containing protein [Alphaproteobacteria bacterium]
MSNTTRHRTPTPAPEVIKVTKRRIWCDGGGGALGHPRVYLEMGEGTVAECGYCDRRYVLDTAHAEDGHH